MLKTKTDDNIFAWLRKQIRERIKLYQTLDVTETAVDVAIKETERFIEYINEAEAKWNDSKNKSIEILKTEKACVERNIKNQCNRECAKCDLLREDAEILQAYDDAIFALGSEAKREADCCEWKGFDNSLIKDKVIWTYTTACKKWCIPEEHTNKHFKYCTYCGKRIKILEVE